MRRRPPFGRLVGALPPQVAVPEPPHGVIPGVNIRIILGGPANRSPSVLVFVDVPSGKPFSVIFSSAAPLTVVSPAGTGADVPEPPWMPGETGPSTGIVLRTP
jgi:hypothetical protein